jgi:hypothetical protein
MLLYSGEHVGQHRGAPWPRDREQVGEARHRQAEIGTWAGAPFLAQSPATSAANVDLEERSGHGVEAGGEHNGVDLMSRPCALMPAGVIASIGLSLTS